MKALTEKSIKLLIKIINFIGILAFSMIFLGCDSFNVNPNDTENKVKDHLQNTSLDSMSRIGTNVKPYKIAFTSDSESLANWEDVLKLVKAEGADMLLVQGDYYGDGGTNFNDWRTPIQVILDPSDPNNVFPVLGPPTGKNLSTQLENYFENVLNKLVAQDGATWAGCLKQGQPVTGNLSGYRCDSNEGGMSGDYFVKVNGVSLAFQNQEPNLFHVPTAFANDSNKWKICLWHGNHLDFNVYDKGRAYDGDRSLPYELYKTCADYGALVINGNTHQYTRTCVLENIGNLNNGGPSIRNRVNREPGTVMENHGEVCPNAGNPNASNLVEGVSIGPGKTMVIASALGGHDWREYFPTMIYNTQEPQDYFRHDYDSWWSTIFTRNRYCRNNCSKSDGMGQDHSVDVVPRTRPNDYLEAHGVLFIDFNKDRNGNIDENKAYGYFKTITIPGVINGKIIDEFEITYDSTGQVPSSTGSTPTSQPTSSDPSSGDSNVSVPMDPDSDADNNIGSTTPSDSDLEEGSSTGSTTPSNSDLEEGSSTGSTAPSNSDLEEGSSTGSTTSSGGQTSNNQPVIVTSPFQGKCLDRVDPVISVQGLNPTTDGSRYVNYNVPDNTVIDSSNASFFTNTSFPFDFAGVNGGTGNICIGGGSIVGSFIPTQTTWKRYHSTSAIGARIGNFLLEGIHVENFGDGIRIANKQDEKTCVVLQDANNFEIRSVYFKDLHDDCVENDWGRSGLIQDSLFEGCYAGFSTRSGNHCSDKLDNTNNVVEIRNSLIYMKPTQHLMNGVVVQGNTELFKDDVNGPQWSLHGNIIRADQGLLGDPDNEIGYGIRRAPNQPSSGDPNSKLHRCSNNIFVWTGPGDLPPPYNDRKWRVPLQNLKDPVTGEPCFTFTKDIDVWNDAVIKWKMDHNLL